MIWTKFPECKVCVNLCKVEICELCKSGEMFEPEDEAELNFDDYRSNNNEDDYDYD